MNTQIMYLDSLNEFNKKTNDNYECKIAFQVRELRTRSATVSLETGKDDLNINPYSIQPYGSSNHTLAFFIAGDRLNRANNRDNLIFIIDIYFIENGGQPESIGIVSFTYRNAE